MNLNSLNEKELKTRTQWIVLLAISTLSKLYNSHSFIKFTATISDPIWIQTLSPIINSLVALLYAYILYYCIYKKPGTKLLTFFILSIPVFLYYYCFYCLFGRCIYRCFCRFPPFPTASSPLFPIHLWLY